MESLPSEHSPINDLHTDSLHTNSLYANNLIAKDSLAKDLLAKDMYANDAHIHAHLDAPKYSLVTPAIAAIILSIGLFATLYLGLIPRLIEQFALTNLKPSDTQVMNFNGVFASPSPEGMRHLGKSLEVSRSLTNGDFILDLTTQERITEAHGYAKAAHEWYVKTPIIGEEAIIITPAIALSIGLGMFSIALVLLVSFALPPSIGVLSALTKRSIRQTRMNLHLQTGLSDEELDVLCLSDTALIELAKNDPHRAERTMTALWEIVAHTESTTTEAFRPKLLKASSYALFRRYCMQRMAEAISPNVAASLENLRAVQVWEKNKLRFYAAFRLFMEETFAPRFSNVVSGFAYGGAAFLIVSVGLRGLRFIPASRPSVLLFTISLECTFLLLLGITLAFQREEASSVESLKRIEQGMTGVSNVIANVDTSIIQRVLQEAAAEYARTPDMQNRVFASIADKAMDAIRAQPAK
jgi:hypothetical protein